MPASPRPRVLLVEDVPAQARVFLDHLSGTGWTLSHVETGEEALALCGLGPDGRSERPEGETLRPDLIALDIRLPDISGMEVLRRIRAAGDPMGVVMITADGSINLAVEAMQIGANDFLVKPVARERLVVTLRNVLNTLSLSREVETLRENLGLGGSYGFFGSSAAMQRVYRLIEAAAPSAATVFVTGESGTGKELVAEALHRASPRSGKPFVALNCAAIPRDLMESEIFGHVRGAFTGALETREGAAQKANGGTLFLDEICEMDPNLQTKLLRFLQTGLVQRVGDTTPRPVDLRIVCATNRDPLAEVQAGRFREDLYYRLHVVPIRLPALRDRGGDALELADHFLAQISKEERKTFRGFSPEATQILLTYHWPGNVRELINVLRTVVVLNDGPLVTPEMMPPALAGILEAPLRVGDAAPLAGSQAPSAAVRPHDGGSSAAPSPDSIEPLWMVERRAIEQAIAACDGNIPRAAALLRVSPSTLYRKRQIWDTDRTGNT